MWAGGVGDEDERSPLGLRGARLKKRLALAGVPLMEINLTVEKNYDHYGMIIVTMMIGIFKKRQLEIAKG